MYEAQSTRGLAPCGLKASGWGLEDIRTLAEAVSMPIPYVPVWMGYCTEHCSLSPRNFL
jgi:hypothetical protein